MRVRAGETSEAAGRVRVPAIVGRLPRRSAARIMLRRAQEITRYERRTAVVVSAEEWDRRVRRKRSVAEFLDQSPLRGSGLEIER